MMPDILTRARILTRTMQENGCSLVSPHPACRNRVHRPPAGSAAGAVQAGSLSPPSGAGTSKAFTMPERNAK